MDTRCMAEDCRIILHMFRLGENIIKGNCSECLRQPEQVICLSEEQAFLLVMMIEDGLQWEMWNDKLVISDADFLKISKDLTCKEHLNFPTLWNEAWTEEDIITFLFPRIGTFDKWGTVCEAIPVLLALNSCYRVVERDSLVYLCMNGKSGAVLFRKLIMKMLSLLAANWYQEESLKQAAAFACNFLRRVVDFRPLAGFEKNREARINCLLNRVEGSPLDGLYSIINLGAESADKMQENKRDVLYCFAESEKRERLFYASRLDLMHRILTLTGLSKFEQYQIPEELYQLNNEVHRTSNTQKVISILSLMPHQEGARQEEAAGKLSHMFNECVDEWCDEAVTGMLDWINGN